MIDRRREGSPDLVHSLLDKLQQAIATQRMVSAAMDRTIESIRCQLDELSPEQDFLEGSRGDQYDRAMREFHETARRWAIAVYQGRSLVEADEHLARIRTGIVSLIAEPHSSTTPVT